MSSLPASEAALHGQNLTQEADLYRALRSAESAVSNSRVCLPAHGLLGSLLLRLGRSSDAEEVIARALTLATGGADAYDGLAWVSTALGQHERANALYRRATELAPDDPRFWYNLACGERTLGRLIESEAACDRAVALDPTQYPAHLLRSELRVQSLQENHVQELQLRLSEAGTDYRARIFLGYALGKELNDLGRFDEAFRWFATAAATRRARLAYEVATDEAKIARISRVYSWEASSSATERSSQGASGARYIFVVGLPRSGTTLVERILTGLAGVRSNGETDNFSRALLGAARGAGDVFERAAAANPSAVATAYARYAGAAQRDGWIIEKLPLNYLYLGAIRRALPSASIVFVRRSPLDSCFAMYRTLFAAGYPFSYDLVDLGRYFAAFERLMGHWREVLGDVLHEVAYEDLVREPRRVGARLASELGLVWRDAAIEIENNRSVSLTASAAQVRRPIYGSSSGLWRHYRPHLKALIETLSSHGVTLTEL